MVDFGANAEEISTQYVLWFTLHPYSVCSQVHNLHLSVNTVHCLLYLVFDRLYFDHNNTLMETPSSEASDFDANPYKSDKPETQHVGRQRIVEEVLDLQRLLETNDSKPKKLGVTWNNLTVKGVSNEALFNENVLSQLLPFGKSSGDVPNKTIIDSSFGCVKPGEMLLVLGRPDAGCTSLLNMLSNNRLGYAEIDGEVSFGAMSSVEAESYRGQIVMNTEEEIFFPSLTVNETIDFATRLRVPYHLPADVTTAEEYAQINKDFLLSAMGIEHTKGTKVGDAYIRGVSGGERKRVSIVECLATRGSVFCWDNSTRGLDASTALEWTRAMRAMTDILGLTTIATLYQAGNGIFEQFDKVLVLDEGKQIFYGPREAAVPFMEQLGFFCNPAANKADFLTGVTVPTERAIIPGFEEQFPRTAEEIRKAYDWSSIRQKMLVESDYARSAEATHNTANFKEMVTAEKNPRLPKNSSEVVGFQAQIKTAVTRQFQIMWGDKATLILKQGSATIQALMGGSLFYNAPSNSAGLFLKSGALFFSLLYPALIALSEVTDSFTGRPILAKHRSFALHHPIAFVVAQIATDIPVMLFQITQFGLILYFLVGLQYTAAGFFTFWAVTFMAAMAMTQLFRFIGAAFPTFDAATKVSGLVIVSMFVYMGYMIIKPIMHPWFVWIYWINPMAYGFEAIMANEFHGQELPCVGPNLVPNGEGYAHGESPQACTGVGGARMGASSVVGDEYLQHLGFSHTHVWRNFGILCAWWIFYAVLTMIFTSRWKRMGEGGRGLLIPQEKRGKMQRVFNQDEEAPKSDVKPSSGSSRSDVTLDNQLIHNTSIFTWKNLTYTVKTHSGDLVLLDNVQGYVKPGMLGALMGSSGAGKTTLLDVLAQRKTDGVIHGSVQVDGRPLPVSFQRSAGYVEQMDVHEPLATVREALEFSALLRQSRDTPRAEKLRYVDTIIELLQLQDIENTLVGRPGAGLSIEQRKRLTIGVELVAKPSILIFLDEPTSGLDGQAAYNTVRFLRKLAEVGQAVLVTIHQPSAQLFAQFDTLLLLSKGGKTVYFGDIGKDSETVKSYFATRGAPCPDEANPAEHMIEVVSGTLSRGQDWNKVWLGSPEYERMTIELDRLIEEAAARPAGYTDDGHAFAASIWDQVKIVTHRMNISMFRNTEYLDNKFALHILLPLINGFTFWQVGNSLGDLQQRLFTIFNLIFVAPGVIAQLQPLFIDRRDIYETREKKSKMYHWAPFVSGLIISELPYLIVCALLYYVCWYFTVGLPTEAKYAGSTFFVVVFYEFLYTGIGQMIAAYAPNAVFASLANPLVITTLVSFSGVMAPYSQIPDFWKYWLYYLDPFNYLMSSLLVFTSWSSTVTCKPTELAVFDPPSNQTCGEYLSSYQQGMGVETNLLNPASTGLQPRRLPERGEERSIHRARHLWCIATKSIVRVFSTSAVQCRKLEAAGQEQFKLCAYFVEHGRPTSPNLTAFGKTQPLHMHTQTVSLQRTQHGLVATDQLKRWSADGLTALPGFGRLLVHVREHNHAESPSDECRFCPAAAATVTMRNIKTRSNPTLRCIQLTRLILILTIRVHQNVGLRHYWSIEGTWGSYTIWQLHNHLTRVQFEFLTQLSEDSQNLVIGLVRDKTATEKRVATELSDRRNIYILHGDLTSYASLKQAVTDTTKLVGDRGVDYLVANASYMPSLDAYDPIGALSDKVEEMEAVLAEMTQANIIGNIHLYNLFLPLVLKGKVKKVITLSSGHADLELINKFEVENAGLYAAFKAALNVIVAKYNVQYKNDGVLFVSISPGVVDVGKQGDLTPAQLQSLMKFMGQIATYAPDFKGPVSVEEGARANIAIWKEVSLEGGHGGDFISHHGNKQWL
ncbi:hypothetical protein OPT61_g5176 [Boeremia exigua]|uniref:Uncharacterized protein n=1 Tax=Boeremia exigua TaxID=749465 RepID=A0ACC2IBC7_9PLEO|nr:hypothetical protein OPT61_g5176 [Boeremia exigua]